MDPMWYFLIWLGVFIIALIIEGLAPDLVSIWFAGGALVALILSLINGVAWYVQVIAFVLTTGILLILSFLFFRKSFLNAKIDKTNLDNLSEQEVLLLTNCDKDTLGEVTYRDVRWKTSPLNSEDVFVKGESALIETIRGNRLIIKKKGIK